MNCDHERYPKLKKRVRLPTTREYVYVAVCSRCGTPVGAVEPLKPVTHRRGDT